MSRLMRNCWFVLKTLQARLRFVVILIAIGGVIAYWDTFKAYYDKWTRLSVEEVAASPEIEYFCPMHPLVIRDHPDKCPICFMPLSRRKKGDEPLPLPAGTVSRVQLSPYRVALAGTQTTEVAYRSLNKEIRTVGFVEFDERKLARISARLSGRSRLDKLYVNVTGQTVGKGDRLALLYSPDLVVTVQNLLDARRSGNAELERIASDRLLLWGIDQDQIGAILKSGKAITHLTIRSPITGHVIRKYQVEGEYVEEGARLYDVADLSTVWIEAQVYEEDLALLREGMFVGATTLAFPNREFGGKVAFIHPHLDQNTRTLTVRLNVENPNHELRPGMVASVKLKVPARQLDLLASGATEKQQQALQEDRVLAVPESSVIDTGTRKIVYRQAELGVFEGVEVVLGPRMIDSAGVTFYPVIQGLQSGDRVVTAGSFLIDAETRLNPAAGSIYLGGSSAKDAVNASRIIRPSTPVDEDAEIEAALSKLAPDDQRLAQAQRYCPVQSDNRLGAMGAPFKVMIQDRPVFLCCKGCTKEAQANPRETLARVDALKAETSKKKR